MNNYNLKLNILSDLPLVLTEDLLDKFINQEIGYLVSGEGEIIRDKSFKNILNEKCPQVNENGRPRCIWLHDDICKSPNGICKER